MNPNPYFDYMMAQEGPEMDLIIERTIESQMRDGLGQTFSVEAMQDLSLQMNTWVGTRVMQFMDAHQLAPQSMKVTIGVVMAP